MQAGLIFGKNAQNTPFKELGLPMLNKSGFMDGDASLLPLASVFDIGFGNDTDINILLLFGGATDLPMIATMLLCLCYATFRLVTTRAKT